MKSVAFTAAALAGVAAVSAQANNQSICDKYSTALLNSTAAAEQRTLLTLLVNSAVIGNYSNATAANAAVRPAGILTTNGTFNGTNNINLLKYFDGSLLSTNRNGQAVSVNFLDGGGAAPLKENKPANDMTSNQYRLLTHLYEYFGYLLGCSSLGQDGFPNYEGSTSQAEVHKFMNLDAAENGYFIQQVAYSALSFGVSMEDIAPVGQTLGSLFNNKCGPNVAVPDSAPASSQSICLNPSCPVAANGTCNASNTGTNGTAPARASGSSSGSGSSSAGASSTGAGSGGSGSSSASGAGASSTSRPAGAAKNVASGVVGALLFGGAIAVGTLL